MNMYSATMLNLESESMFKIKIHAAWELHLSFPLLKKMDHWSRSTVFSRIYGVPEHSAYYYESVFLKFIPLGGNADLTFGGFEGL